MSNIKETNLEYFTEWNNAETSEDKIRVNSSWVAVEYNDTLDDMSNAALYNLAPDEVIKRKRKTIVINGVEVVAPRYDNPRFDEGCYWINPFYSIGFYCKKASELNITTLNNLTQNGWFDSEDDIREFLAAIKGNTNE